MAVIIDGSNGVIYPDGSGQKTSALYINNQTIASNVTFSSNTSASATGPIFLANNVVVTLPSGTRWVVL
jgi:hypothetical protein